MIYDVFTYNNEVELLDLHLNVLNSVVDQFVIVEADKTFSGQDKPLYFAGQQERFRQFMPKIKYYVVDDWHNEERWALARSSPNTAGAEHWSREFYIKESIKDALQHLKDDDIVFIGDVDEIYENIGTPLYPHKMKLRVYAYWLDNRSSEVFWGTTAARYKDIKNSCLNHLRTNAPKLDREMGWHFTSMGGYNAVDKKLQDSYTEETYYNQWVKDNLEKNIADNKDFLGRDFQYKIDETDWPQYLKDNKDKYIHLCKTPS